MISAIGFMIGAYIFVRMVSLITRTGEREENIIVKVLAFICMLVTGFCIYVLWGSGSSTPQMPGL